MVDLWRVCELYQFIEETIGCLHFGSITDQAALHAGLWIDMNLISLEDVWDFQIVYKSILNFVGTIIALFSK